MRRSSEDPTPQSSEDRTPQVSEDPTPQSSEDPTPQSPFHPIIAIDGGAGTGKTTSAARVAERLGFCYADSGALYRAMSFALREAGFDDPGGPGVEDAVRDLPLEIEPSPGGFRVILDGRELEGELRTPEISHYASRLAVRSGVRERVRGLLREAGRIGPLVVEGRDIGTVVFPEAVLKVFLTADLHVRAERRRLDLLRQGIEQEISVVASDLAERDRRDSTRADSPLRCAEGAVVIDTGTTDIEGQVRQILDAYARVTSERPADPAAGGTAGGTAERSAG